MEQRQIKTTPVALDALTKAIGGATTNGVAIGIKQNDAASLTAKKEAMVAAEGTLDAARTELKTRQSTLAAIVFTAIAFITLARNMLTPRFGNIHSSAWDEVGFVGSLKIPRTIEDVKYKLQKLITFLTANPDAGSAERNITAARAQSLLDDIVLKQNAVTAQEAILGDAVKGRRAAVKMTARTIAGLLAELKTLIDPLDMRYLSFGLNRPGAQSIPDVPQDITAVLIGANAVTVRWAGAPRAEYYRVWLKINGVDQELKAVGSPADLDFTIEGLPANSTIEVAITAVNNGGESQKSAVVTVAMH